MRILICSDVVRSCAVEFATWLSVLARTEYFSIVAPIIPVPEMMGQVLGLPLHASSVKAKINKDKNCPSLIGTSRLRAFA